MTPELEGASSVSRTRRGWLWARFDASAGPHQASQESSYRSHFRSTNCIVPWLLACIWTADEKEREPRNDELKDCVPLVFSSNARHVCTRARRADTSIAIEGETVHVLVGKSVVINVQAPLTRCAFEQSRRSRNDGDLSDASGSRRESGGQQQPDSVGRVGTIQVLDVAVDLDIAGLRNAIQRSYPKEQLEVEADAGRLVLTEPLRMPISLKIWERWRAPTLPSRQFDSRTPGSRTPGGARGQVCGGRSDGAIPAGS